MGSSDFSERFWSKVDDSGGPEACWLWTSALVQGYGKFRLNRRFVGAHRLSYELLVGPIPEGLTLDHLCRTPACVNPAHLEPVTMRENLLRSGNPCAINATKTHCVRGHPLEGDNIVWSKTGRACRTCRYAQAAARRRKKAKDAGLKFGRGSFWMNKTHCPHGHPYDDENTYIRPSTGRRACRECRRISNREIKRRKRAEEQSRRDRMAS
jgi:hypothetical protein